MAANLGIPNIGSGMNIGLGYTGKFNALINPLGQVAYCFALKRTMADGTVQYRIEAYTANATAQVPVDSNGDYIPTGTYIKAQGEKLRDLTYQELTNPAAWNPVFEDYTTAGLENIQVKDTVNAGTGEDESSIVLTRMFVAAIPMAFITPPYPDMLFPPNMLIPNMMIPFITNPNGVNLWL